jgi:hypothetical protein
VRVDFYFVAPSLGITSEAPQPIGTAWTTLLAGHSTVVTCPQQWTPPEYPTNLHACVIVTCSAPVQHDTPTAPANPALDRHVGQRNLTVLEGGAGDKLSVQLLAANLLARKAQLAIVAAATWSTTQRMLAGPLLVPSLGSLATARAAARTTNIDESRLWMKRAALRDVAVRSGPQTQSIDHVGQLAQVESLRTNEPIRTTTAISMPPPLTPHVDFVSLRKEVHLEPGQTATANLEIEIPSELHGDWLAVHLAQSQNGQLTGGYTMLIRTRA